MPATPRAFYKDFPGPDGQMTFDERHAYVVSPEGHICCLGPSNFDPATLTDLDWANSHHSWIDITNKTYADLLPVLEDPIEKLRQNIRKAIDRSTRPLRPKGYISP